MGIWGIDMSQVSGTNKAADGSTSQVLDGLLIA